jgi:uncharacterized protein YchJ
VGRSSFGHSAAGVVAAFLIATLTACATVDPRAAEETVKARAQARWNALVLGDVKSAYDYFSPGSRATSSLADFASGIRIGFWKAVTVDKVECGTPDRCEVHTTIEYEHRGMRIKTPHRETWIREDSNWWFLRR